VYEAQQPKHLCLATAYGRSCCRLNLLALSSALRLSFSSPDQDRTERRAECPLAALLLSRPPARSCVFSHECSENTFAGDGSVSKCGPDDVIPPILEAFQLSLRNVTDRYLAGNTSAFWDKNLSRPVLPTGAVMLLVRIAHTVTRGKS